MKLLLLSVFLFGWAGVCVADSPPVWKLEDCIRAGLERSATALNARRSEWIAEEQVKQARSQAFPRLSMDGGYTRLDELQIIELNNERLPMGTLDNYSVEATLRQTVYAGGKVAAGLRAAGEAREYARWLREEMEAGVIRDIRKGYHRVILSRATVKVLQGSVQQLEALYRQAEARFEQQAVSEFDVLTARVRWMQEQPEVSRAQHEADLALSSLQRVMGVEELFEPGGLPPLPALEGTLESLMVRAAAERPACRAQEAWVALQAENVAAVRGQGLPEAHVFFTYNGANSYRFVSFADAWEMHWSAGFRVSWNVWDGGLTRSQVRESILSREQAHTELDALRRNVRLSVQQAFAAAQHAQEWMRAVQGTVDLAERALVIARRRYETGLSNALEMMDAQVALKRAMLSRHMAETAYRDAVADLEFSTGIPWNPDAAKGADVP